MLRNYKLTIFLNFCVVLCLSACQFSLPTQAQDSNLNSEAASDTPALQRPEILKRQTRLARQYELLEEKLFTLYGFERDKNPTRSKLLEKAFKRSQASATNDQLKEVVALIESAKLPRAQEHQEEVLDKLKDLLALLQSEDRSKRLKDEIERYQEYLKEVEKLLRLQKGLRGQAEGGIDAQRIAKSESQAAERAGKLSDQIKLNEEEVEADDDLENAGQPGEEASRAEDQQSGEDKKLDQNKDGSGSDSNAEQEKSTGSSEEDSTDQQSPLEESQGGSGQQSEGDVQPAESKLQAEPPAPPANPIRQRIDAAEDRMKEAQKKLQEARRDDAIEEMKEAEKEIAQAKKQLEEILRQMREEDVERTLAKLEERFRKMLERQIKVKQSTEKLAATAKEQRSTDFDVQSGKLSTEQNAIGADAGRALLLLAEDGSSVAFLQTVDEMQQDMKQIAARLSSAKVGKFTIDLETEVIDTLNYLIASLAEAQRENEEQKDSAPQQNPGTPSPPGEEPLVGKIAELKMLRSLQDRIYRRHQRYSKQLQQPDDPVGMSDDPELVAALQRLTIKQKKLTRITQEIVQGSKQ